MDSFTRKGRSEEVRWGSNLHRLRLAQATRGKFQDKALRNNLALDSESRNPAPLSEPRGQTDPGPECRHDSRTLEGAIWKARPKRVWALAAGDFWRKATGERGRGVGTSGLGRSVS
ncbi:unnamed protein product [Cyclocybe aegerita]|uniref:Uncharacterized protein n=1 Tax=Cyclocybe aegerita TaxID=1973307 RepID=A0A8S0X5Z1_CYCAE|nr:unnamed protein product [Cyclocybe aegerita]